MSKNVHTHLYAQNITKTHTCSSDVHWHSFKINWLILIQILERRSFEANQLPLNESSSGISTEMTWLFNQEYDSFHVVFTKWRWTVGHWRRLREEREDMFLHHDHQQDPLWCVHVCHDFRQYHPLSSSFLPHIKPLTMAQWVEIWFRFFVVFRYRPGCRGLGGHCECHYEVRLLKASGYWDITWAFSHFDGIYGICLPPCLGRFFHKDVGNYAILGT